MVIPQCFLPYAAVRKIRTRTPKANPVKLGPLAGAADSSLPDRALNSVPCPLTQVENSLKDSLEYLAEDSHHK